MMAMETLEALRDALAAITGVASCKIGIEKNISPSDYPMIRVVPQRIVPGKPYQRRTVELRIYFGADKSEAESTGLEGVYASQLALEELIRDEITKDFGGRYLETIMDDDRLDTYKISAILCEVTELPVPAPAPP